jgi:hypothetical protein
MSRCTGGCSGSLRCSLTPEGRHLMVSGAPAVSAQGGGIPGPDSRCRSKRWWSGLPFAGRRQAGPVPHRPGRHLNGYGEAGSHPDAPPRRPGMNYWPGRRWTRRPRRGRSAAGWCGGCQRRGDVARGAERSDPRGAAAGQPRPAHRTTDSAPPAGAGVDRAPRQGVAGAGRAVDGSGVDRAPVRRIPPLRRCRPAVRDVVADRATGPAPRRRAGPPKTVASRRTIALDRITITVIRA